MRWLQRPLLNVENEGAGVLVLPDASRFEPCDVHGEVVSLADLNHDHANNASPLYQLLLDTDAILAASPTGDDMMAGAASAGYHVQLIRNDLDQIDIDTDARILFIPDAGLEPAAIARSPYFRHAFMLAFIRGLRAIDQIERAAVPFTLRPDQALMFTRAMTADQYAVRTLVAYELKHETPALWRHLLGSNTGDIAVRFAHVIEGAKPHNIDTRLLTALRSAFLAWYRNEDRVNAHDHDALEKIDDDMNGRNRLLQRAIMLPGHINALCLVDDISYTDQILHDAIMEHDSQNLPDPINTSHLHHIMLELDVTMVNNIGFHDTRLANLIFPG